MYKSCTSGPVLVKPQATWAVRPSTMKGKPGKLAPITSMPEALDCSRAKYQIAGAPKPRCGSLAKRGLPLLVWLPATTQLLLPLPSTVPASAAMATKSAGGAMKGLESGFFKEK